MSFRWSEDTTLKFVSLYVEHECLWNVKSPLYKNKQIKQSAYLNLENSMNLQGFGEKEIKLKIKNIRSTYSQELKKIKDSKSSGAGSDTVYIPSVKWYSILDASLRNLTTTLTQSESNLASNSTSTDTEQTSTVEDTVRGPTPPPPPLPKKKKISQLSSMVQQLKEITNTTNTIVDENEFEVFGKHIGLQLKSLPLLLAIEAQEHIQLYLNNIRRQHLQNTGNSISSMSQSSHAAESSYSDSSIYNNSNPTFKKEALEHSLMVSSGPINNNGTQNNMADFILTAMHNADVNK